MSPPSGALKFPLPQHQSKFQADSCKSLLSVIIPKTNQIYLLKWLLRRGDVTVRKH